MPLSDYSKTKSTLWVESEPNADDFHPLDINIGEIAMFHGTLVRHYAPGNPSEFLRASMDFRIGVDTFFDPQWRLEGLLVAVSVICYLFLACCSSCYFVRRLEGLLVLQLVVFQLFIIVYGVLLLLVLWGLESLFAAVSVFFKYFIVACFLFVLLLKVFGFSILF
ncbi:unnamed protein product [Polarella glacialis]|uniref:Uncharacterized protein n=1 Tax=Polarella glacialis TaxID=89957 RepID=A0A813LKD8_POLGL|nr:unnamed protein product [Polarella glacialis]